MTDQPVPIEPGDLFYVEYGNGKRAQVRSLNLRQQRLVSKRLIDAMKAGKAMEGGAVPDDNPFDITEECLRVVMPDVTDEFIDTLSNELAQEIVEKCLSMEAISEEEKKS